MKKIILAFVSLFSLVSCLKDSSNENAETSEVITEGKKWTLQIGSTYEEVYAQLQALGKEKNFSSMEIVNRKAYTNPEEVQEFWKYYNHLYFNKKNVGYRQATIVYFKDDKVSDIRTDGVTTSITAFPTDISQEKAIQKNDAIEVAFQKLTDIFTTPNFTDYELYFYYKPLLKPFDPDMVNYAQWFFSMTELVSSSRSRISSVLLSFSNGKLSRIEHVSKETDVYN